MGELVGGGWVINKATPSSFMLLLVVIYDAMATGDIYGKRPTMWHLSVTCMAANMTADKAADKAGGKAAGKVATFYKVRTKAEVGGSAMQRFVV